MREHTPEGRVALRVLLVDDEADIRHVAALGLKVAGQMAVTEVGSCSEALEAAASRPFDLIVLDVMMPGQDGVETFRQLRLTPASAHVPIVFLTAKLRRQDIDALLKLGALGVLPKPFDPVALPGDLLALLSKGNGANPRPR